MGPPKPAISSGEMPEVVKAAATGTMMSAANISIPWMKSVQQAAKKPPEEGVGDDDDRADGQRHDVVEVEDILEELRAGAEGGGGVDEEKDEDDHRADAADRGGLAAKAVLQILRDGDRVVGDVGELAQAHGDELPVEIGAEREAMAIHAAESPDQKAAAGSRAAASRTCRRPARSAR